MVAGVAGEEITPLVRGSGWLGGWEEVWSAFGRGRCRCDREESLRSRPASPVDRAGREVLQLLLSNGGVFGRDFVFEVCVKFHNLF